MGWNGMKEILFIVIMSITSIMVFIPHSVLDSLHSQLPSDALKSSLNAVYAVWCGDIERSDKFISFRFLSSPSWGSLIEDFFRNLCHFPCEYN